MGAGCFAILFGACILSVRVYLVFLLVSFSAMLCDCGSSLTFSILVCNLFVTDSYLFYNKSCLYLLYNPNFVFLIGASVTIEPKYTCTKIS